MPDLTNSWPELARWPTRGPARHVEGYGELVYAAFVTAVPRQIFLLGEVVVDEQLGNAELNAFLATARVLADQLTR
jgi:hypothetical protein